MKLVLVVLICLGTIYFVALAGPTPIWKNCCLKYSKSIPHIKNIKGYRIQENNGRCRIKAVVFKLKSGRICSDPDNNDVKELLEMLLQKEK